MGAGPGAVGSTGMSPASVTSGLLCWWDLSDPLVTSPRGFGVGVLTLSLSLKPCEYPSILGFALK